MITTKSERLRLANSLSSVSCHERKSTLDISVQARKPISWSVHKPFPIAVFFGHLRTAKQDTKLKATDYECVISNKATKLEHRSYKVPTKFSCNFYGVVTDAIH